MKRVPAMGNAGSARTELMKPRDRSAPFPGLPCARGGSPPLPFAAAIALASAASTSLGGNGPSRGAAPEGFGAKIVSLLAKSGEVWRYSLIKIGGDSIQVGQIVTALLIVLLGLWLSKRLTKAVRRRLLKRARLDISTTAAIEKMLFYGLVVLVLLFAFQVLQIPITLFAFLGGALAIGLGFGAQNIIANFISGLILMIERPIRIGDMVEVESHQGIVEEIRFRCTRVRRLDGIDVLVPNSAFLDKNVINWTLSDRQIRTSITLGVVYGSPTDQVAKLIRQAVDEHPRALQQPEPVVEFEEFGNNALVFRIHFWIEVVTMMDLRTVRSDIRFRIDGLFREAAIVIAFPQQDVHLDTRFPLDVRILPHASGRSDGEGRSTDSTDSTERSA